MVVVVQVQERNGNIGLDERQRREKLRLYIRLLSLSMVLIYVIRFVLSIVLTDFRSPDSSFTIPFAVVIAYCGFVGSLRMQRDMLACFYTCCYLAIILYFVNILIQTREAVNFASSDGTEQNDMILIYITIGLETILVLIQLLGGIWGKELVVSHFGFQLSNAGFPIGFRTEFVGGSENFHENPEKHANDLKYTVDCLAEEQYSKLKLKAKVEATAGATDSTCGPSSHEITGRVQPAPPTELQLDICVICQDEFTDEESVKILPCGHYYHAKCVAAWLERSLTCPMCMVPVPLREAPSESDEVQVEIENTSQAPSSEMTGVELQTRATSN